MLITKADLPKLNTLLEALEHCDYIPDDITIALPSLVPFPKEAHCNFNFPNAILGRVYFVPLEYGTTFSFDFDNNTLWFDCSNCGNRVLQPHLTGNDCQTYISSYA
jgi:hypothetical protein